MNVNICAECGKSYEIENKNGIISFLKGGFRWFCGEGCKVKYEERERHEKGLLTKEDYEKKYTT